LSKNSYEDYVKKLNKFYYNNPIDYE